jgi:hypothetical protein
MWKVWKAKKPAFHPSHILWKSLWDSHIPTASTAGMYLKSTIKEKRESQIYGPSTARDL